MYVEYTLLITGIAIILTTEVTEITTKLSAEAFVAQLADHRTRFAGSKFDSQPKALKLHLPQATVRGVPVES